MKGIGYVPGSVYNKIMDTDLISIVILLLLSGFFSGSESALFSLQWWRLFQMEQRGGVGRVVVRLMRRPHRLLITILLGNTLVNVAASSLSERVVAQFFPDQGLWLAITVMTFWLLLIGEIGPKTLAVRWPETIAKLNARPLKGLMAVLAPITFFLERFIAWTTAVFRRSPDGDEAAYRSDFIDLVREGEREGILKAEERLVVEQILKMDDVSVTRIMTPRTRIFALPEDVTYTKAVRAFVQSNLRRIPLFRNTLDNIVGVLYAKDVLGGWYYPLARKAPKYLARPPFFVPGCISVEQVYFDLNDKQVHFAVVLDEYGGTAGIVTHEDILNFLFGAVTGSQSALQMVSGDSNEVEVPGMIPLEQADEMLSLNLPDAEKEAFKTLNGFLINRWGHVPEEGETLRIGDWLVEIKVSKGTRIETAVFRKVSDGGSE